MKDSNSDSGRLDVSALWQLLEELEAGTLDGGHQAELEALLISSPAARRAYLEFFQQSAVLRMEAAKLHEQGLMPVIGSGLQTRRNLQRSLVAAAAVVMLAGVVAALIAVARPRPAKVAAVVTRQTEWTINGIRGDSSGTEVEVIEGSTIRVASGTVRLETESGNLVVVQGPAEVRFPSFAAPQVRKGWLWIDAQASEETFVIGAGAYQVRDIGTRFGVRVPEDGSVEVHLIEGRVEVRKPGDPAFSKILDAAKSALAFPANGVTEEVELAADPFPKLPQLLARPADYRTTVLGQSPAGYWPLDETDRSTLANKVHGGPLAVADEDTRIGEPGVGRSQGFHGWSSDNFSIYLGGSKEKSVITRLGGPLGIKRKEGAVSFWFRREPGGLDADEVLWLAGVSSPTSRVPTHTAVHTRIDSSGRLVFEVANGESDVLLSSTRSLADGHWHHVAASWSPSSVDLHVDGQLMARDVRERDLGDGRLTGRHVRFGKPSRDLEASHRPFRGWVDEIASWTRPLSQTEVEWQYRSALGATGE
jgi:ferric-dicitrate binding protein FerR (iron transport regulator)